MIGQPTNMRYIYFLLIILFSFIYSSLTGTGKNDALVTGEFKELKIEQFVQLLESSTGYRFYYDPVQFGQSSNKSFCEGTIVEKSTGTCFAIRIFILVWISITMYF
jgi:hypothetical protein